MGTVVLLGFSTAGKSTILKEFSKLHGGKVEAIDTDKRIAELDHGHIYDIFFERVSEAYREAALKYIERREGEVLDNISATSKPRLIAAGPSIPWRER